MYKQGVQALSNGVTAASVAYGVTFASGQPELVMGSVWNVTDSNFLFVSAAPTYIGTTGCTFALDAAVDSANYKIGWFASDTTGPVGTTGATGPTGGTGATGPAYTSAVSKPINRLPVTTSISDSDYLPVVSTSGGIPVTARASLSTIKTYISA